MSSRWCESNGELDEVTAVNAILAGLHSSPLVVVVYVSVSPSYSVSLSVSGPSTFSGHPEIVLARFSGRPDFVLASLPVDMQVICL